MPSRRKLVLLGGAPALETLQWDDGLLLDEFIPTIRHFIDDTALRRVTSQSESASMPLTNWRLVPLYGQHLRTDLSQSATGLETRSLEAHAHPSFLGNTAMKVLDTNHEHDTIQSNFIEHSFAVHVDLHSSQLADSTVLEDSSALLDRSESSLHLTTSNTLESLSTNYDSTALESEPSMVVGQSHVQIPSNLIITNIKRLPKATDILRIQPQTITINVICAIISISPPRTVALKKNKLREMEIIELLVGDDTATPFSITFWLLPQSEQESNPAKIGQSDGMRQSLTSLRRGNVVLLTNVALHTFRDNVYGQSLNRRMTRNETRIQPLGSNQGVSGVVAEKVDRVTGWARAFVGSVALTKMEKKRKSERAVLDGDTKRRRLDELPPDTP